MRSWIVCWRVCIVLARSDWLFFGFEGLQVNKATANYRFSSFGSPPTSKFQTVAFRTISILLRIAVWLKKRKKTRFFLKYKYGHIGRHGPHDLASFTEFLGPADYQERVLVQKLVLNQHVSLQKISPISESAA